MGIKKILSKVWNKLSSGSKFAAHYAEEASEIAEALRLIVSALPIGSQDRSRILQVIDKLDKAADNITEFLAGGGSLDGSGPKVTPKANDVKAGIADYLDRNPTVLTQAIANAAAAAAINGKTGDGDGGPSVADLQAEIEANKNRD